MIAIKKKGIKFEKFIVAFWVVETCAGVSICAVWKTKSFI
jgi:hypothetical protein